MDLKGDSAVWRVLGTVMCYGQTGAGKTFTTTGSTESYQNRGIIPRAISQLFRDLDERSDYATVVRFQTSFTLLFRFTYLLTYERTKLPGLRADMLECPPVRTEISGVDTRSFLQPPEDSAIHSYLLRMSAAVHNCVIRPA